MSRKELWDGWFIEDDAGQTIRNLLTTAEKDFVLRLTPEKLIYAIEEELWFIGPYTTEKDYNKMRDYLHVHKDELFTYAILQCANGGDIDG